MEQKINLHDTELSEKAKKATVDYCIRYEAESIRKDMMLHTAMMPFMLCSKKEANRVLHGIKEAVRGFYTSSQLGFMPLYDEEGTVGGHASVIPINGRLVLSRLHVKPENRGCGLGSYLVEKVISAAKDAGSHVELMCSQDMVGFYERIGFREVAHVSGVEKETGLTAINCYVGNCIMTNGDTTNGVMMNPILTLTDKELWKIAKRSMT